MCAVVVLLVMVVEYFFFALLPFCVVCSCVYFEQALYQLLCLVTGFIVMLRWLFLRCCRDKDGCFFCFFSSFSAPDLSPF